MNDHEATCGYCHRGYDPPMRRDYDDGFCSDECAQAYDDAAADDTRGTDDGC